MAEQVIRLPDVGEGIAEAELVEWHVKVGDLVRADMTLAAVMTDKATVEMTSPVTGKVISIHGEPGQMAAVGSPLVELEVEGAGNVKAGAEPAKVEKKTSLSPGTGGEGHRVRGPLRARLLEIAVDASTPPHPNPLPHFVGAREEHK